MSGNQQLTVTDTIGSRYTPVIHCTKQLRQCGGASAKVGNVLSWSGDHEVRLQNSKSDF